MNLLCLSKRRPQKRDLITRPYGRFFYLPKYLAEQSHEVRLLLLSYKNEPPQQIDLDGIHCYSESLLPWGPRDYFQRAEQIIAAKKPDWIIGFSDIWYALAAFYLGHKHGIRVLIDAYDNYESYIPWFKPLHSVWRTALYRADAVTAAGPNLANLMAKERSEKESYVVPMSADPIFTPLDKNQCRRWLNLPLEKKILGYCGGFAAKRGYNILFDAFERLKKHIPDLVLVLSGRMPKTLKAPKGCLSLGYLPDHLMPVLLNSLDTLSVLNMPSAFGSFSYPSKLYEAMRCRIPVVVSRTPSTEWILSNHPEFLVPPFDSDAFAATALETLQLKSFTYSVQNDWKSSARILSDILQSI
jgi:glycosyltransferase involved in cell wall biosynthesis